MALLPEMRSSPIPLVLQKSLLANGANYLSGIIYSVLLIDML